MKLLIPKNLPQFDDSPALFISAGAYEAHFYLAQKGELEELESFTAPRQAQNFNRKFQAKVEFTIHSLLDEYQFGSIYLFAPKYVASRITKGLEPIEEGKIKIKFFGEYAKFRPLELLKMYWERIELLISASIVQPASLRARKMIDQQNIRHPAAQKIKI